MLSQVGKCETLKEIDSGTVVHSKYVTIKQSINTTQASSKEMQEFNEMCRRLNVPNSTHSSLYFKWVITDRTNLRPGRFTLQIDTRYPLYRRLGWLQSRSGKLRKISSPPWFESRTDQSVATTLSLPPIIECCLPKI